MRASRSLAGVLTAAAATALTGCGGGSTPAPPVTRAGNAIIIKNFTFTPGALTGKVGEDITVTNNDSAVHTITATNKTFDSPDLSQGEKFTFRVAKPGTYTYVCDIHQYMKGSLTVA